MTLLTLDASVICKWFLQDADDEDYLSEARALMDALETRAVQVMQPAHTTAEVLGVLVRRRPRQVLDAAAALAGIALPVWDTAATYRTAVRLALQASAHLFDTLYHAVALETEATLITANTKYLRLGAAAGRIAALRDFRVPTK
jgi:predicted nucleic acid-binding protein